MPLAVYPKEGINETDFSVLTGVIKSLDNIIRGIDSDDLSYIELGNVVYRIDKINDHLVITKFDKRPEGNVEWFFDLLLNALYFSLKYVREEDGVVESYESSLFSNILKKFYEKYEDLIDLYSKLREAYETLLNSGKPSMLDKFKSFLEPEIDLNIDGNEFSIKVRTGDIDRFIEILKTALNYMRSEV